MSKEFASKPYVSQLDEEQKEYVLDGLRENKYNSFEELHLKLKKLIRKASVLAGGSFAVVTNKTDTSESVEDATYLPSLQTIEDENIVDTTGDITKGDVITYSLRDVSYPVITTEEQTIRLLSEGMSSTTVCIKLPLSADSFILKISYISDENYYPQIYYNAKNGSTIFAEYAGLLDEKLDEIEVSLMPANTISGRVTNSTDYQNLEVMAVHQENPSIPKEYTYSKFVCSTSEFGKNGEYVLRVPAELSYVSKFTKGDSIFIPAQNSLFELQGKCKLILTYI